MTETRKHRAGRPSRAKPSAVQAAYLRRGLEMAGGKLPIFDRYGQRYRETTIRSCINHGWAKPWINNPTKPDWLVCKLTAAGRDALFLGSGVPAKVRPHGPFGQARELQLYLEASL